MASDLLYREAQGEAGLRLAVLEVCSQRFGVRPGHYELALRDQGLGKSEARPGN